MKTLSLLTLLIGITINVNAQSVGINTSTPDASAILDITHTNRGLLIPRLQLVASNNPAPVTTPALSLLVFNLLPAGVAPYDVKTGYYYWDGTKWVSITSGTTNILSSINNIITSNVNGIIDTSLTINNVNNTYNTTTGSFITNVNGVPSTAVLLPTNQAIADTVRTIAWLLSGNSNATATSFLGTTNAIDLVFKAANTECMRMLNTNGNVGIGTSTPTARLEIFNSASNILRIRRNTGNIAGQNIGNIAFAGYDNTGVTTVDYTLLSSIAEGNTPGAEHGTLTFWTKTGGTMSEKMRITGATGNVGIGTIAPVASLHINGAGFLGRVLIENNQPAIELRKQNALVNTGRWMIWAPDQDTLKIQGFNDAGGGGGQLFYFKRTGNSINSFNAQSALKHWFIVDNTTQQLGIGTNTPANKLEITEGTAGNSGLRLTSMPNATVLSTNASGDVIPTLLNPANALFWGLTGNSGTNATTNFIGTTDTQDLVVKTNGIENMRILNTNGNVGIGTSTPGRHLHSQSTTNTNAVFDYSNSSTSISNGYGILIQNNDQTNSNYASLAFGGHSTSTGTIWAGIAAAITDRTVGSEDANIAFWTKENGVTAEKAVILNNGNVGIGTTNPAVKLEVSAASSNLLTLVNNSSLISSATWGNFIRFTDGVTMAGYVGDGSSNKQMNLVGHFGYGVTLASYQSNTLASVNSQIRITASGDAAIRFDTKATERMVIDSTGQVGINILNPSSQLHIVGTNPTQSINTRSVYNPILTADITNNLLATFSEISVGSTFNFNNTLYGAANRVTINAAQMGTLNLAIGSTNDIQHNGTSTISQAKGSVTYARNASIGSITDAIGGDFSIQNIGTGTITNGYGIKINPIQATNKWSLYATDPTAPSYFAGAVGIGTTIPTEKLHVVGNILASGTITPSDARYKQNVVTLTNALHNVLQLRGVTYDMKAEYKDKGFGTGTQIGVIAQEVEAVYPQLINTSTDGYKGVDYSKFTPILIEAIKEQQTQIEILKKEIELLKNK